MRMTGVSVTVEPWKLTVSVPVTVTVTVSEQLRTLLGPPGGLFTEGCVALQGGGGALGSLWLSKSAHPSPWHSEAWSGRQSPCKGPRNEAALEEGGLLSMGVAGAVEDGRNSHCAQAPGPSATEATGEGLEPRAAGTRV